jgi:DNA-binding transcriptional regulator YiaG
MTIALPDLRAEREGVAHLAERLRAPRLPPPAECRAIRLAAGATLRDIAAALRVNAMTISRWERGVAEPWPRHRAAYLCLLAALAEVAAELNQTEK